MKKEKFGDIEEAKKIKSRFKRIKYIYDNTCKTIDALHKGENICGFNCNKCIIQQINKSDEINGCCRTCRYQSKKGCTTSNLTCKLFYCDEVRKKYKVYDFNDLELLTLLSKRQRLILKYDLFSSREEVLLDLYLGSIVLSAIRLIYSCYKNSYYLIFKNRMKNKYGKLVIISTLAYTIMFLIMCPVFLAIILLVGIIDDIIINKILVHKVK